MNLALIKTVVVGLNGALQKRFVLGDQTDLIPGNVHRASELQTGVGGKGQDVAVTLGCLEYSGGMQLAQFVGSGAEGDVVYQMLEELLGDEAMGLTVRTESGMRTCTSIVGSDTTTELVEPSGVIAESEMNDLMAKLEGVQADALCIMGSMPPGCADETYADIYSTVATPNTLCLIDSVVGLEPLLKAVAKVGGPTILKVNASELCRLANVSKTSSEAGGVQPTELVHAISAFLDHFTDATQSLSAIAVTDGAHPGYLAVLPVADEDEFRLFQMPVAKLSEPSKGWFGKSSSRTTTLYPIGAGDAVAGGTLAAWTALTQQQPNLVHPQVAAALSGNEKPQSRAMLAAFGFGLACGSASCRQEQNSVLKVSDALELYRQVGRPMFLSSHKTTKTSTMR